VLVAHTAAFSFSLVALVGVPRSHSQASLIAAPTLSTTPTQHEAVIGTVIGRQCGELRRLSLRPGVEFVLFAQRAVFGSDYEDGRRVHSSKPSSAWAAQIARHGFKVPRARPEWVREPDRVTMKLREFFGRSSKLRAQPAHRPEDCLHQPRRQRSIRDQLLRRWHRPSIQARRSCHPLVSPHC